NQRVLEDLAGLGAVEDVDVAGDGFFFAVGGVDALTDVVDEEEAQAADEFVQVNFVALGGLLEHGHAGHTPCVMVALPGAECPGQPRSSSVEPGRNQGQYAQ